MVRLEWWADLVLCHTHGGQRETGGLDLTTRSGNSVDPRLMQQVWGPVCVCVCGVEGLTSPPSVWGQSQSACHLWQLCCRCVEGHGEEGIYQAANNHWATGLVAHNVRNLLNKCHGLIVHIENVGPSQWPAYSAGSAPSTLSDPCSSLSPIPIADHSSLASRVPCYAHLKAVPCSFLSVTHSHHPLTQENWPWPSHPSPILPM